MESISCDRFASRSVEDELGAIALTRASLAPVGGLALVWVAAGGAPGDIRARLQKVALVACALILTVGPWLIRNYRLRGSLTLSSQTGRALWIGNDPQTFSAYPSQSIDRSADNAYDALSAEDQAALSKAAKTEIGASDWYARRAWTYIREHPWLTLGAAARKIGAGFWWKLNPLRGRVAQAAYFIGYAPVAVLGIMGMFFERRRHEFGLIAIPFLTFICVSAVFWAHTSHRSYLDVYWIVLAASVVERTLRLAELNR